MSRWFVFSSLFLLSFLFAGVQARAQEDSSAAAAGVDADTGSYSNRALPQSAVPPVLDPEEERKNQLLQLRQTLRAVQAVNTLKESAEATSQGPQLQVLNAVNSARAVPDAEGLNMLRSLESVRVIPRSPKMGESSVPAEQEG
ncbi:MAG: hypothetical protein FGM27_07255 [Candidatus Omnitrophica bacterium]|nr:hypothetical protein [Candidatus Omnitrophota bacterium]